eukprot:g29225.t1
MKPRKVADKDTPLPDAFSAFFARFEQITSGVVSPALDAPVATVTTADFRLVFLGVNPRKETGPNSVPRRALRLILCGSTGGADAISLAMHSSLEHLNNKLSYVRLLLIDFSSAFDTINPSRLISKLQDLGLGSALCNYIFSFLTHRQQSVRI